MKVEEKDSLHSVFLWSLNTCCGTRVPLHITHINNNNNNHNNSKKHRPDRAGHCCGPILGLITPISAYSVRGSIVLGLPRV